MGLVTVARKWSQTISEKKASVGNVGSVTFSILLYTVVSIGIVFLNRRLFSSTFKYPIFVSWVQQIIGVILYKIIAVVGETFPRLYFLPNIAFDWKVARSISPLSVCFVGMIGFSNTCLRHTPVSTYLIARSLTLLFNLILSTLLLKQHISRRAWIGCVIVMVGFIVGSVDKTTIAVVGLVTGAVASLFQAGYNVQIKRSLTVVGDNENVLMFYNLLLSSVLFVPLIFVAGEGRFWEHLPKHINHANFMRVWGELVLSGILGTAITFASYLCIRMTSPVTFNIVGYAKSALQAILGILVLHEAWSGKSIFGILLTLSGSFYYSRVKMKEAQMRKQQEEDDNGRALAPSLSKDDASGTGEGLDLELSEKSSAV